MRRRLIPALVMGLLLVVVPFVASAQEQNTAKSNFSFTLEARTWVTTGHSSLTLRGPVFPAVRGIGTSDSDHISDLRWRGLDSLVTEVTGELVWKRLILMASVGLGDIIDGAFIDHDQTEVVAVRAGVTAPKVGDRTDLGLTRGSVDDEGLFFVNANIGGRLVEWREADNPSPGYVDVFAGFQYWHEKYVAIGGKGSFQLIAPPIVPVIANRVPVPNVKSVTQDYYWRSVSVGGRTQIPLVSKLMINAKVAVLPWSSFTLDDVHHLRDDMKKNPSFSSNAEGGFGYQLDGTLTYTISKGFSIEAGYQYWRLDSAEGDTFARALTRTLREKLREATTERYGPYFGLQYRF